MRAASPAVKLTYDDFVLFPDDGKRHELIDVIRVSRREGSTFDRPIELSREAHDTLTTALLPGLEMPLARIFSA